tara:strand:+ start:498 stop:665 length:168 start_codon:yes stop_codon:yes gene_type:complete
MITIIYLIISTAVFILLKGLPEFDSLSNFEKLKMVFTSPTITFVKWIFKLLRNGK